LCPNGTAFDQEAQICADWGDVDCEAATLYYGSDNFDLYRIGSTFESKKSKFADEEESVFHLQHAETSLHKIYLKFSSTSSTKCWNFFTGDARRSKQYIVNQSKQNTVAPTRQTTTSRPSPSPFTAPSTTTTTTTFRPTYEKTSTARIVPSTYRPTTQPKSQFVDNSISTYRPKNIFFNSPRSSAGNGKQSNQLDTRPPSFSVFSFLLRHASR
jgi:hypothetical protein